MFVVAWASTCLFIANDGATVHCKSGRRGRLTAKTIFYKLQLRDHRDSDAGIKPWVSTHGQAIKKRSRPERTEENGQHIFFFLVVQRRYMPGTYQNHNTSKRG